MDMSRPPLTITPVDVEDLPRLSALAGEIWRTSYPGIISVDQIEYMLTMMYDVDVMRRDIEDGIRYDVAAVDDGQWIGFAAYGPTTPTTGEIKLHKLYLRKEYQGAGLGHAMLQHVMSEAAAAGYNRITLNVNKGNVKAIRAYERTGFTVDASVVVDIGGGYVMDDYVMTRSLQALSHSETSP